VDMDCHYAHQPSLVLALKEPEVLEALAQAHHNPPPTAQSNILRCSDSNFYSCLERYFLPARLPPLLNLVGTGLVDFVMV
jgi:hypothetical protein